MSTVSRRLMVELECLSVAKASLDQEKTRVLVEIQGTMGDLTLKLHAIAIHDVWDRV